MNSTFAELKEFLLKFNYPRVQSMTEDELADVFADSNRCFLVSWILKYLDSVYEEEVEQIQCDAIKLGNFLNELGFCSKRQGVAFMKGQMPVEEQLNLLLNIFSFVKDCKDRSSGSASPVVAVTIDDIQELNNLDLNLFPMYGGIKLPKPNQMSHKTVIEDLEELDKTLTNTNISEVTPEESIEGIDSILKRLKDILPKIEAVTQSVDIGTQEPKENAIKLDPESGKVFKKCNEHLKVINRALQDIKTIQQFAKGENEFEELYKKNVQDNEYKHMLRALHSQLAEVLKVSLPK